jgi:hypothetical protein
MPASRNERPSFSSDMRVIQNELTFHGRPGSGDPGPLRRPAMAGNQREAQAASSTPRDDGKPAATPVSIASRRGHHNTLWRLIVLAATMLVANHLQTAAQSPPLTTLDYRVSGARLSVTPAALAVPKNIAGSVATSITGPVPEGAYIEAFLRGPSFPARRLVGVPGQPLLLPPLNLGGRLLARRHPSGRRGDGRDAAGRHPVDGAGAGV